MSSPFGSNSPGDEDEPPMINTPFGPARMMTGNELAQLIQHRSDMTSMAASVFDSAVTSLIRDSSDEHLVALGQLLSYFITHPNGVQQIMFYIGQIDWQIKQVRQICTGCGQRHDPLSEHLIQQADSANEG